MSWVSELAVKGSPAFYCVPDILDAATGTGLARGNAGEALTINFVLLLDAEPSAALGTRRCYWNWHPKRKNQKAGKQKSPHRVAVRAIKNP